MNGLILAVKRHPLVTFFALAYGLSWGNFFLSAAWPGFPFLYPFGPLLAAIIVASVTEGLDGLKDLLSRCLRWRVGFKWYAAALFVPIGIALTATALNILLGAPMPIAAQLGTLSGFLLMFPLALVDAPLGEDSGWRGYALPRFPANRTRSANTLMLALLLAGWHLPLALSEPAAAAPFLIGTIASAFVTNWVYYNAHESALLAMLYHTSANAMGIYLGSMFLGSDLLRQSWLIALVNCVVAVILVIATATYRQPGFATLVEAGSDS
jgi:uncharacterized protein